MTNQPNEEDKVEISFKTKEHPEARSFEYAMPESLEALVAKFGEEAVYGAAKGAIVINLQALARRHIEKSDAEIQELATNWTPGERSAPVAKSAAEKASSALSKLSEEERRELLQRYLGQQA
jgi:hypothetical protein